MFKTFDEIEHYVLSNGIKKRIVLCGAHDEPALSALVEAKRKGVAQGILIGNEEQILNLLTEFQENPNDYEIIHEVDEMISAKMAVSMVKEGTADIPMKGFMQTSSYMRAILDKKQGLLPEGRILSETTAFEYPDQEKMMFVTDCAINIEPNIEAKVQLIHNAVELAHCFGVENVKVAVLSSLEKVNPKIQSTVEADKLAKMNWNHCIVDGPYAFDNAVSEEAAKHKGIHSKVAGKADILLCSCLDMGNVIHKCLNYFAHLKMAGALCGTESPVIITSRTDSPNTKYNSILTAILQSLSK